MTLLIKNAKVYQSGKLIEKNIFIENSRIQKITSQDVKADAIINAKDKVVIPGLIDCHVHFREPGLTHKEDFFSGSCAAAAGGITSFLDMPNTIPATTTVSLLEQKRKLAQKSIVNYGFHFGSTTNNIEEIKKAKNVASVKVYMNHTTGDLKIEDDKALQNIFTTNKTVAIHAEGEAIVKAKKLIQQGANNLYVCHVSSEQELNFAKKEKIANNVYAEVCPHHLFMDTSKIKELHYFAEMKPNLKTTNDQKALWLGINNGMIDTIASDHAPHTIKEKTERMHFGVPGCETMFPLLLNEYIAKSQKISFQKIIELCSENPASIFKIKNKGRIQVGYGADFAIIDLNLKKEVIGKKQFTKCKWTPFEGMKLQGWPIMTIANGNVVFDEGKINKNQGKELMFNA